jgi:flavorubredoxin
MTEIASGIYAVGSIDFNRRIFDALAPTPMGTTYNCYLVRGSAKTALIDTVHTGYENELSGKIDHLLGSHALDYIVMNHAEPDHAGAIRYLLDRSPAALVTTPKGAELARLYFKIPADRIKIVKNDETIDLGARTLRFLHAPFLHWPETMFTYIPEDEVLFSCDFFSAHNTSGIFDDHAEDLLYWARRYYGEIMMPLAKMGRQGMAKLKNLDIKLIGPSHGPVYRRPSTILTAYDDWTSENTRHKAMLIYVSMYGTIASMVRLVADTLMANDVDVQVYDLAATDIGELAGHLVDTPALVLGTPTVLGAMHPLAMYATIMIKTLRPPLKYGLLINSYGWGKGAIHQGIQFFEDAKIETIASIEINGVPEPADNVRLVAEAERLAEKIKAVV